jgi:FkbM family methyltransferase
LVPYPLEDIADYEQTLIDALRSQVRIGDRVTIVGGGEGVTAVVAAKAVGEKGSVVCFEGNRRNVRKVKATVARNKMSNRLTVKHAVVGEAIAVYGVPDELSTLVVSPAELPECDILERTARARRA